MQFNVYAGGLSQDLFNFNITPRDFEIQLLTSRAQAREKSLRKCYKEM